MCSQRENRTYADAEVVSVVLADVLDEVDRVIEPALGRLPLFDTARRVTTQCQDVAASRVVGFLEVSDRKMRDEGETAGEEVQGQGRREKISESAKWGFRASGLRRKKDAHLESLVDHFDGHVCARQMHAGLEAEVRVRRLDKVGGRLGSRPSCAPPGTLAVRDRTAEPCAQCKERVRT